MGFSSFPLSSIGDISEENSGITSTSSFSGIIAKEFKKQSNYLFIINACFQIFLY